MSRDTNHISIEKLADYVEQRLVSADVQQIEAHLATDCVRCQEELARLAQLITLMRSDDWVSPPPRMQKAVRQAFRDHSSKRTNASISLWDWLRGLFVPRLRVMATALVLVLLVISSVLYQNWRTASITHPTFLADIDGSIKLEFAEGAEWEPGPSDGSLLPGTLVRTGQDSSVALHFFDDSVTKLDSNAVVQIMQASEGRSANLIALEQSIGQTHYRIPTRPSSDSRFEIKTPLANILLIDNDTVITNPLKQLLTQVENLLENDFGGWTSFNYVDGGWFFNGFRYRDTHKCY